MSVSWPLAHVEMLVQLWADDRVQQQLSEKRNRKAWQTLTRELNEATMSSYHWLQCKNKIDNTYRATYKQGQMPSYAYLIQQVKNSRKVDKMKRRNSWMDRGVVNTGTGIVKQEEDESTCSPKLVRTHDDHASGFADMSDMSGSGATGRYVGSSHSRSSSTDVTYASRYTGSNHSRPSPNANVRRAPMSTIRAGRQTATGSGVRPLTGVRTVSAVMATSTGRTSTDPIANNGIVNDYVSGGHVGSAHIGDAHDVGSAHVGSAHGGSGHGGSAHVGSGHVGSAHVGSAQCGSTHVGSGHVGSSHVSSGHVGSAHGGGSHVGGAHVGSGHVGSGHVGSAHVGSGHVGSAHGGGSHVGGAHVGSGHVGSAHVGGVHVGSKVSNDSASTNSIDGSALRLAAYQFAQEDECDRMGKRLADLLRKIAHESRDECMQDVQAIMIQYKNESKATAPKCSCSQL